MILKLNFSSSKGVITLKKNYNYLLQAFFYQNIDDEVSKFLHDEGFAYRKKKFKLFTFSKVIGDIIKKQLDSLVFRPNISIYFASPISNITNATLSSFIKKREFDLDGNKLVLNSVEAINPEVSEEKVVVRCLSPITAYRTDKNAKKYVYFNPNQEEFYDILKSNLLQKYEIVYGKPYSGKLRIYPIEVRDTYKKKVNYKDSLLIEAWDGTYGMEAEKDMIKLALEAGLGPRNSQGFGMVRLENVKGT
jgi:CRISPR-associated endoribonuclease Cas6